GGGASGGLSAAEAGGFGATGVGGLASGAGVSALRAGGGGTGGAGAVGGAAATVGGDGAFAAGGAGGVCGADGAGSATGAGGTAGGGAAGAAGGGGIGGATGADGAAAVSSRVDGAGRRSHARTATFTTTSAAAAIHGQRRSVARARWTVARGGTLAGRRRRCSAFLRASRMYDTGARKSRRGSGGGSSGLAGPCSGGSASPRPRRRPGSTPARAERP